MTWDAAQPIAVMRLSDPTGIISYIKPETVQAACGANSDREIEGMDRTSETERLPLQRGTVRIGEVAPMFRARSTMGGIDLEGRRGRWVVLFFHPADFTPVCTSEFVALARAAPDFAGCGCDLIGVSVDSLYAHLAWVRAIRELFGVDVPFPICEDPSMAVARAYGLLDDLAADSSAVRASFVLDPEGIIRAITWYPATVGRSIDELLRLVQALQRAAPGDALTPADWKPGEPVLEPPLDDPAPASAPLEKDWFHRLRDEA